jgi:hypothetical protein
MLGVYPVLRYSLCKAQALDFQKSKFLEPEVREFLREIKKGGKKGREGRRWWQGRRWCHRGL